MSRLTGTDVLGLFEAYQAVYVPQELTEEQVWEEVENWVNSLLEEGYDLSDYTWEEMYEEYLRESPHLKEFFGPGMDRTRYGSPERTTRQRLDLGVVKGDGKSGYTISNTDKPKSGESTSQWQTRRTQAVALANRLNKETGLGKNKETPANPPSAADAKKDEADPRRNPTAGSPQPITPAGSPPSRPASASGPVLSKKDGVEGTGVGANFKARAFTAAEKSRYASVAAKNAAVSPGGTPAATSKPTAASQLSPGGRASNSDLGSKTFPKRKTAGGTEYEVRTPTRAEMEASRKAGGGEAGVKAAVERSSKLMGGPEGPGEIKPDPALKSITKSFSPKPAPARNGFGVSAAPIAARASVANVTAPSSSTPAAAPKPPTPTATPVNRATGSKKPGSIVSSFDMFDVVKGYLIGEGYADTEEAALAIMANMSEDWVLSIIG
jgi:hypothetical protein